MTDKTVEQLKEEAFAALREAEKKMHSYASACEVGDEREKAFEIFENIRLAPVSQPPNPFFND